MYCGLSNPFLSQDGAHHGAAGAAAARLAE